MILDEDTKIGRDKIPIVGLEPLLLRQSVKVGQIRPEPGVESNAVGHDPEPLSGDPKVNLAVGRRGSTQTPSTLHEVRIVDICLGPELVAKRDIPVPAPQCESPESSLNVPTTIPELAVLLVPLQLLKECQLSPPSSLLIMPSFSTAAYIRVGCPGSIDKSRTSEFVLLTPINSHVEPESVLLKIFPSPAPTYTTLWAFGLTHQA